MTYADLTAREREFLDVFARSREKGPTAFLMIIALVCALSKKDSVTVLDVGQYSCGDFKRAIKALRMAQIDHPEFADSYEDAVQFIRRAWLHREAVV